MALRIEQRLKELVEQEDLPGATAAFQLPDGRVETVAVGFADVESRVPMQRDAVMPAGSIGKSFVAAVALGMVRSERLHLDRPIAQLFERDTWFADLPNAPELTLRNLLNHSSGIDADVLSQPEVLEAFVMSIREGTDISLTHEDLVRGLAGVSPRFEVGEGFSYSDANYVLVGLVLERIAEQSYEELLRDQVLDPLGLRTVVPTQRKLPRLPIGYRRDDRSSPGFIPARLATEGSLVYDPSFEWTGGGIAANVSDLARWARAFYGGSVLPQPYMKEMLESANGNAAELGFRYGLGVQLFEEDGRVVYGHGGWIFGYVSGMYYHPDRDFSVAIQINKPTPKYTEIAKSLADLIRAHLAPSRDSRRRPGMLPRREGE